MPRGRILELKNNYGIIDTDAYKVEHEWIPFRIEKSMLEEKEGKQYIKYTDEVEFSLSDAAASATAGAKACEGIVDGLNTMVDTVTKKTCVLSIEDGILTIREA